MKKCLKALILLAMLTSCAKEQARLPEDRLVEIGENLVYFTMKQNIASTVEYAKGAMSENAVNSLMSARDLAEQQRNFYRGDIAEHIIIQKVECQNLSKGYLIKVGYIEDSIYDMKLTTFIILEEEGGIITDAQIYDVLDNPPSSDWMWAEG